MKNFDPTTRKTVEQAKFSGAFQTLEGDICDLTRAARLAIEQLHRAVGELDYENGKCVEVPDAAELELARYAVNQVHDRAAELQALWYRLHNGACDAGLSVSAQ